MKKKMHQCNSVTAPDLNNTAHCTVKQFYNPVPQQT